MGQYFKQALWSIAVPRFAFWSCGRYRRAKWWGWIGDISILAALALTPAYAAQTKNLTDLSLEQLGNLEVTSVSGRAERLSDAAASIYVITAEDIRRSGATTLPEALRLAPNLQVARVSASSYAISARGFNNAIGNKLLVLIDGRTVYTPLFSGVFWDTPDVMLEDVERIEVISGPGATLWGANAVNGVINVITHAARDTQRALVSVGGGNREVGTAVRYGGKLGEDGHFRVYGKGFRQFNTERANGTALSDRFEHGQVGFRADWGGADPSFTLQGDAYSGVSEPGPVGKPKLEGANLLARWTRQLSEDSSFRLQAYFDRSERNDPLTFKDQLDIFDIEFHHALTLATKHKVLWGGGYRYARDKTRTNFNTVNLLSQVFIPANRNLIWRNLFVQDEIALSPELHLTLGVKVETNVYTGAEFLPSARLAWKPADNHMVWGAVSRAVRAPARLDRDFFLFLQLPGFPLIPVIKGGPDFQSEVANVIELGYRAQPTSMLSYSITLFTAYYDKLRSGQPPPAFIQNAMDGTTRGVEAWGNYQVTPAWKLSAGLALLKDKLGLKPGSPDPIGPSALGNDPAHQWSLRSALNLSDKLDFDVTLRHVGGLPDPAVDSYTAVDARLGWRLNPSAELSLTVQNIFDPGHIEFGPAATASEIQRSVFLKLLLRQ